MIPTPRSDAEACVLNNEESGFKNFEFVHADFARQLERELVTAKEDAAAAWKTAKASDQARLVEMAKRDAAVALLQKCETGALLPESLRCEVNEFLKSVRSSK